MSRSFNQHADRRHALLVLAGSGIVIAASVGAVLAWQPIPRDAANACRVGIRPERQTVVIVDHTDPWPPAIAALIAADITRIADNAAPEERITVLSFTGTADSIPPVLFDRCKPPASGNMLYETPQHLARQHRTRFAEPLQRSISQATRPASAKHTELVQFLARLAARVKAEGTGTTVRLVIYSDMDEHSAGFSFSKRGAGPELFAKHIEAHLRDRLAGIALTARVLPLPSGTADPGREARIARAWTAAFAKANAKLDWEPL